MVLMNRPLRKRLPFSALAIAAAVSLPACGGGSRGSALPEPAPASSSAPASYTGALADTKFTITIPLPKTGSAAARSPQYVSASTTQLRFTLVSATAPGLSTAGQINSFNTTNLGVKAVTLGNTNASGANCPGSGPWTCTIPVRLPPGTDNVRISAENSSNVVYAEQQQTFSVVAGSQNNLTTVLDANVNTMTLNVTSGFCSGTYNVVNSGTVATVGTQTVSVQAAYKDSAGNVIPTNAPGRPVLTVNGHTDDNGGGGYSDPGNLNVKVTQSTQSFSLQKTDGTGSASVAVTVAPPNTNSSPNDGLSFATTPGTTNFTLTSGSAVGSNFLADAELILDGNANPTGGVIHFWTINGTGFHAGSPSSLTATPVAGPANSDVDFPNDLLFDGNSDLLIANGGSGSPDFGNFSCVPAGSITTGANNATVLSNGTLDDPTHLAFSDPRTPANGGFSGDSSVALTNSAAGTYAEVQFVLNGTYTAAPTSRDIVRSGNGGGISVVAVPASATNPSGSYAVSTYDGPSRTSKVEIIHPDGSIAAITDPLIAHAVLAWDATNNELIVASDGRSLPTSDYTKSNIQLWRVNPVSKASGNIATNTDDGGVSPPVGPIAASATGGTTYVAVQVLGGSEELNVYTSNGTTLTQVGKSLDYGASDCASGGGSNPNYYYGGSSVNQNIITALRFLGATNTLLVALESEQGAPPNLTRTTANGMYLYDVSQTPSQPQTGARGCDAIDDVPLGTPTINQTFFQVMSNRVLGAAYKP